MAIQKNEFLAPILQTPVITNTLKALLKNKSWLLPLGFLLVLAVDLAYSFYRLTLGNAGGDNQWYGATLFWSGINPYTACLESTEWFMTAYPNYAHFLYILLFPLTFFDWGAAKIIWFILNVASLLAVLYLFVRKENVPKYTALFVGILMLLGSTYTNALYQAQMSVIIMACIAFAWLYRKNTSIMVLCLAVVFTKYSFGLPVLLGFFLAGYYKESIAAFAINMFSVLAFTLKFDIAFLETLVQPFAVASRYTEWGHSDIISLFRTTNPEETIFGINYFTITLFIVYIVYTYLVFALKPGRIAIVLSSILLAFSMFFHLDYDYSVLLAVILIALSAHSMTKANLYLLISISAYFWLYPMIPKLLRTFLHVDTGIYPVEWFGHTAGTIFIAFNTALITFTAFRVLRDRGLDAAIIAQDARK